MPFLGAGGKTKSILFDDNIFHAVSVANYTSNAKTGGAMLCLRL